MLNDHRALWAEKLSFENNCIHVWRWQRFEKLALEDLLKVRTETEARLADPPHKDPLLRASFIALCETDLQKLAVIIDRKQGSRVMALPSPEPAVAVA